MQQMNTHITDSEFTIVDKQSLKQYLFKVIGNEEIETDIGKYNTVMVNRTRAGSSRSTTLWLAKELFYLPIKIQQKKDGNVKFEMEIKELEGINKQQTPSIDISHKNNTELF